MAMERSVRLAQEYHERDFEWWELVVSQWRRSLYESDSVELNSEAIETLAGTGTLAANWEEFYRKHKHGFFKMRSYLLLAFRVLDEVRSEKLEVVEVGCGTGAAMLPLLHEMPNAEAEVFDVSPTAIESLKEGAMKLNVQDRCIVHVCDAVTAESFPFQNESKDFALMIFTLSGISPEHHKEVLRKTFHSIKPGGFLCFRDYGLFDMAQTRCRIRLGARRYIKQDGVQVSFFSLEDILHLMSRMPEFSIICKELRYCCIRNVNRKTNTQLDRVFVHGVFQRTR